jgi:tetratricopeptide (TPR) repeat protein
MDRSAALQPLDEAAEPIRRLVEHQSTEELGKAIQDVAAATERSLRAALGTDPSVPGDDRLAAPSPDAMRLDRVIQGLRARDRISLETAGSVHELMAAARRAGAGELRPGDGELASRAVARLRADLGPAPTSAPTSAPEPGAAEPGAAEPVASEPGAPEPETPEPGAPGPGRAAGRPSSVEGVGARRSARLPPVARGGGRWVAWVGAGLAVLVLVGLAWALAGGGDADYDAGMAAFRAARWDSAAVAFERVVERRPVDVTAMLYLSRAYRRQGRAQEAAGVLREAARAAPEDADVRRELGHLFMDLDQPTSAVQQYERAVEYDSGSAAAWAGLVRALRAVGDPRADRVLEEAPPEVRAELGRPGG